MRKVQTTKVFSSVSGAVSRGYTNISCQGSSRSSKTYNIMIYLINYLMQHPGLRLSVIRQTLPALRGSVLNDFYETMEKMGLWRDRYWSKSDLIYKFPNKSRIEFFGTENEQKVRGWKRDIMFLNEANEIPYLVFKQLQLRTSMFTILDYNPSFDDDHWIVNLNKDPRTYHFITTYKDNPFLEQKIINEIESLRDENESLWTVYGLGLQAAIKGAVYTNMTPIKELPENRYRMMHTYGMDFGFTNDPATLVDIYINMATREIYLDELIYETGLLNRDLAERMNMYGISHDTEIFADAAEPKSIEEIQRIYRFNVKPAYKNDMLSQIQFIQGFKIYYTERSSNLAKESRNYVWKQNKDGKFVNEPVDAFNHIMDAIRYGIYTPLMGYIKPSSGKSTLSQLPDTQ